jgi:hypothetical protein
MPDLRRGVAAVLDEVKMITSETVGKLAEALCKAQAAMQPAAMTGKNPHLKNRYATLNDVMDAARKPLSGNGLSYVQMITTPQGMDGYVGLSTRLMHTSGEWIEDTVAFPVDPGSNRAVNAAQTAGSTITYMRRYALSAMLGIVADEDTDGNHPSATANKAPSKSVNGAKVDMDEPPDEYTNGTDEQAVYAAATNFMPTAARLTGATTPEIKESLKQLGFTSVSGNPGERVKMLRLLLEYWQLVKEGTDTREAVKAAWAAVSEAQEA